MEKEKIINDIYSINYYYFKNKLMGPYYKEWIKNALEKNNVEYIENNNNVIAFLTYLSQKRKPIITIQKLAVRSEFINMGYGKILLNIIKEKAKKENRIIKLKVAKNNKNAIDFYKSQGFFEKNENDCDYAITMILFGDKNE